MWDRDSGPRAGKRQVCLEDKEQRIGNWCGGNERHWVFECDCDGGISDCLC